MIGRRSMGLLRLARVPATAQSEVTQCRPCSAAVSGFQLPSSISQKGSGMPRPSSVATAFPAASGLVRTDAATAWEFYRRRFERVLEERFGDFEELALTLHDGAEAGNGPFDRLTQPKGQFQVPSAELTSVWQGLLSELVSLHSCDRDAFCKALHLLSVLPPERRPPTSAWAELSGPLELVVTAVMGAKPTQTELIGVCLILRQLREEEPGRLGDIGHFAPWELAPLRRAWRGELSLLELEMLATLTAPLPRLVRGFESAIVERLAQRKMNRNVGGAGVATLCRVLLRGTRLPPSFNYRSVWLIAHSGIALLNDPNIQHQDAALMIAPIVGFLQRLRHKSFTFREAIPHLAEAFAHRFADVELDSPDIPSQLAATLMLSHQAFHSDLAMLFDGMIPGFLGRDSSPALVAWLLHYVIVTNGTLSATSTSAMKAWVEAPESRSVEGWLELTSKWVCLAADGAQDALPPSAILDDFKPHGEEQILRYFDVANTLSVLTGKAPTILAPVRSAVLASLPSRKKMDVDGSIRSKNLSALLRFVAGELGSAEGGFLLPHSPYPAAAVWLDGPSASELRPNMDRADFISPVEAAVPAGLVGLALIPLAPFDFRLGRPRNQLELRSTIAQLRKLHYRVVLVNNNLFRSHTEEERSLVLRAALDSALGRRGRPPLDLVEGVGSKAQTLSQHFKR